MTPKFDNYINTLLENEHEKEGMSTAKKAALGVGAAAALGGLGYLAGKKLGGNVGGKIGQLTGKSAGIRRMDVPDFASPRNRCGNRMS